MRLLVSNIINPKHFKMTFEVQSKSSTLTPIDEAYDFVHSSVVTISFPRNYIIVNNAAAVPDIDNILHTFLSKVRSHKKQVSWPFVIRYNAER